MSASVLATVAKMGLATLALAAASAALSTQATNQAAGGPVKAPATNVAPAPGGAIDEAKVKAGRELFGNWSCNSCHALADAKAEGHVGPAFDGNANLTVAFVKDRVTNGQGAMPAFGGQMTDAEIDTIAEYIVAKHIKP